MAKSFRPCLALKLRLIAVPRKSPVIVEGIGGRKLRITKYVAGSFGSTVKAARQHKAEQSLTIVGALGWIGISDYSRIVERSRAVVATGETKRDGAWLAQTLVMHTCAVEIRAAVERDKTCLHHSAVGAECSGCECEADGKTHRAIVKHIGRRVTPCEAQRVVDNRNIDTGTGGGAYSIAVHSQTMVKMIGK